MIHIVMTNFGTVRVKPETFELYEHMCRKTKNATKASHRRAMTKIEGVASCLAEYQWAKGSELREI